MKKITILFFGIIISLLVCNTAFASDNFFVGTDTVDEVYEDLDIIMEESHALYQDGELTLDELNFERTQKIFIDTLPYLFKEKKTTADSLKELLNNSDYVYYITNESVLTYLEKCYRSGQINTVIKRYIKEGLL